MSDWGDHPGRGNRVGCTGTDQIHYGNAATTWLYCPDGPANTSFKCIGGAFVGAKVVTSGATIHATDYTHVCDGLGSEAQQYCYERLSYAAVY
jgi:hypothetical protein